MAQCITHVSPLLNPTDESHAPKTELVPIRLFYALLFEMVSGNYLPGGRFLSHRRIMKYWKVSTPSANKALAMLKEYGVVVAATRSGHYLPDGFRQRALALLSAKQSGFQTGPERRESQLRARLIASRQSDASLEQQRKITVLMVGGIHAGALAEAPENFEGGIDIAASLVSRSIFVAAGKAGYGVEFLVSPGTPEADEAVLARIRKSGTSGVILIRRQAGYRAAKLADALLKQFVPLVGIFNDCEGTDMVSFDFNNYGMGLKAAEILTARGHRRCAVLRTSNPISSARDRVLGFQDAMRGIEDAVVHEMEISELDFARCEEAADFIKRQEITAIFSVGYEIFVALLPALRRKRLRIPTGISALVCSSIAEIPAPPGRVDILHMDFGAIGSMAFHALADYQKGTVRQRCYLINTEFRSFGSVQAPCKR